MSRGWGDLPNDDEKPSGLTRARVVEAALDLVQRDGLDALTMRALADRLGVKAASLYWHVRDRGEILELLAAALLAEVGPTGPPAGWRDDALALCAGLERLTTRRRDAARVLLEVPEALEASRAHATLSRILSEAGLSPPEAATTATLMLSGVLVGSLRPADEPSPEAGRPVLVAVDTGSRGVTLRAGSGMSALIRVAHDPTAAAPVVIRGNRVIVRRLRGGRRGELELNPAHPWRFQVQAPTWNTLLDLPGLDVREIHVDSGAVRVECVLPPPRGVVPIDLSSGVAGVRLRRPPGVPVVAEISAGAFQLRLDGRSIRATALDTRWESVEGAAARDHYLLKIHGGTVRVTLEEDASIPPEAAPAAPQPRAGISAALNVVLDGVAARSAGPPGPEPPAQGR
jgi:AcrR family transcriptional regulator